MAKTKHLVSMQQAKDRSLTREEVADMTVQTVLPLRHVYIEFQPNGKLMCSQGMPPGVVCRESLN